MRLPHHIRRPIFQCAGGTIHRASPRLPWREQPRTIGLTLGIVILLLATLGLSQERYMQQNPQIFGDYQRHILSDHFVNDLRQLTPDQLALTDLSENDWRLLRDWSAFDLEAFTSERLGRALEQLLPYCSLA